MLRLRHYLLAPILLLALALPAAARQLTIQHFDERITIDPNATIEVTEMIDVHFIGGPWHGFYRKIPVKYPSPDGLSNLTFLLKPLSVTDDNGKPLKYETSRQGSYLRFKIYIPNADNSTRTVILRYRVFGAVRFFSDHDELYWNVTGNEWDMPIDAASAHIELPADVTGLHATAYTGVYGSRAQQAQVDVQNNAVDIRSTAPLGFRAGLTAVVGWDKGFVHPPSALQKTWLFLRSNWPYFFPIIAFFVMLWLWWTRGRDPERDSVTVQYGPPDKLTPGECGTLVDDDAGMRDITATLVSLAVQGYMTIEQKQDGGVMHFLHHKDYIFHLKKPPAEWSAARPHEKRMLSAIFSVGDPIQQMLAQGQQSSSAIQGVSGVLASPMSKAAGSTLDPPGPEDYSQMFSEPSARTVEATPSVALSDLQNSFYTSLPAIKDAIFDALLGDGYYLHRPDVVRKAYWSTGALIGFLFFAGSGWLAGATGITSLTWVFTGLACAGVICGFGTRMPARTITGARTYAKVLGFEDFLGRVEKDRIERLEKTPALFEKYLPYAMALHVEKGWVQQFSGIAMQPPSWFQGYYGAGFMPYLLVSDLNAMTMQAGTVMASSPRSVGGGSGFGGGGMAGGGFGGGGGGGF